MTPEEFEFGVEVTTAATAPQRTFLDLVSGAVHRLRPDQLDLGEAHASIEDGCLTVLFPHSVHDAMNIGASVDTKEAIVFYGVEHEHFLPGDPANGRVWPLDGPDFVVAAFRFLEQLLLGRVELEVRQGFVMQRTRSIWINDADEREVFLRGGKVLPRLRRAEPEVVRFDFGVHNPP